MSKPRISYVDPAKVTDKAMIAEFERCAREGTPRPESQAIRAHVPAVFWSFANSWRDVFKNGVADHDIKGIVPGLRVALGEMRVLRQSALDEGGVAGPGRG